ncbi:MAG: hypothetical protein ACLFUH_10330, partial [Bacteroidales bacterium]
MNLKSRFNIPFFITSLFFLLVISIPSYSQNLDESILKDNTIPSSIVEGESFSFQSQPHSNFPSTSPHFDSVNAGTITNIDGNNFNYAAPFPSSLPFVDTIYAERGGGYDTAIVEILPANTNIYTVYEDGSYCSGETGSEVW